MNDQNEAAQLRRLRETALCLQRAGFQAGEIENLSFPVKLDGYDLCRITAEDGLLYRQEDVVAIGAERELREAVGIYELVSAYMTMLERAPQLQANGLQGDYRILADFGDAVLAGHPTERCVQFVTWEWDWDRKGVHQGNYFQENYESAKRDFSVRSGLIPKDALFEPEQLAELHRALAFVRVRDESLTFGQDREIQELMEQIQRLSPEAAKQEQTIEQTM